MTGEDTASQAAAERPLAPAVTAALSHLTLQPEDVALGRLALSYARTIDTAATIASALDRVRETDDNADELGRLRAKVSAHATMADLGPKLLAVLESLGATPKARSAGGKAPGRSTPGKLHALRGGAAS